MHRHDGGDAQHGLPVPRMDDAPLFPGGSDELSKGDWGRAEPGFRGVDSGLLDVYGACASANAGDGGGGIADSCVGKCGGEADGCFCDDDASNSAIAARTSKPCVRG